MKNLNIENDGVELQKGLVSNELIQSAILEVENSNELMPQHGVRNAEKKFPSFLKIIYSNEIQKEARNILGKSPDVVRVIFFDKTPSKNWLVTWHQDRTVSVSEKFTMEGWRAWTIKDHTYHAQPPLDVLNNMVTFRIHLDSANEENGCLKVIPRSHKYGILSQDEVHEVHEVISKERAVLCIVNAGDTLIMRPHILHSSSKAVAPEHRRVIHIEFSSYELPNNISWA